MNLEDYITNVPDFPKAGINFKDISPLLASAAATRYAVESFEMALGGLEIDMVVGIESRGFMLGSLIAQKLNCGFAMVRKPGKLPGEIISQPYELEYGYDSLEIGVDAIKRGANILLHDDVLATGGTAQAACRLIEKMGGNIVQCCFLMELEFLKGSEKLAGYEINSLITY